MGLQVAGDVSCAEHLSADAAGDFAFVSDHVGTESVFGGKSGGTGLQRHDGGQSAAGQEGGETPGNEVTICLAPLTLTVT